MNDETKFCKRCETTKTVSEFHRHPTNKDRRQTYCKPCSLEAHKERRRNSDGKYKYSVSPETRRAARQRYKKNNAEKYRARKIICDGVRAGYIKRQPCELCGAPNAEAHHDDYSKPRDVRWLCREHHREFHRQQRINQQATA